jgi:hypothetical protein
VQHPVPHLVQGVDGHVLHGVKLALVKYCVAPQKLFSDFSGLV